MTVVAAVDGSAGSAVVAREAETFADRMGTDLHLVHVVERAEYQRLVEDAASRRQSIEEAIVDDLAEAAFDSAADGVEGEYATDATLGSDVAEEILETARELGAEYVVVGGRRRSPVGKALVGSVSQSVILDSDRPVVVVMDDPDAD